MVTPEALKEQDLIELDKSKDSNSDNKSQNASQNDTKSNSDEHEQEIPSDSSQVC